MRLGAHREGLALSAKDADQVIWYQPEGIEWSLDDVIHGYEDRMMVINSVAKILDNVSRTAAPGTHIVVMSNGGFEGIHGRLIDILKAQHHV
jgi:UDP-N-acetylmuramate: L-alanyl-gamma-D-glutamyl-meso-diaminopimelate ligase